MKVNSNRDISFKSIYTSKAVKRSLEFAADYGALFGAAATVGFSALRPVVIMSTPKTEKENREIASAKSIVSSVVGFSLISVLSLPLTNAIKKIDKKPERYLTKETIKTFQGFDKNFENSKGYIFASQLFKLGLGAVAAIPKAVLVAMGIPYLLKMFDYDKKNEKKFKGLTFRGNLSKGIGNIMNRGWFKKFVSNYKDTDFPMHITAITDIIATGAFIHQTHNSKKIKEERKKALIYNAGISTGLCIIGGYGLNSILDKPTEKFIQTYKKKNFGIKNLEKQIQGIKIAKPMLILGSIYYMLIPFISTFLAEKADKNFDKKYKFILE